MAELFERLQAALGETYRFEKELGGGGMSRVFLAEEVRLGRKVVVKVLPPELSMDVSIDRFQREMQVAANLQHPHIVPLLTAGAADDLLYFVMPFIEGDTLRGKLRQEGELPIDEAVRILREVVDALATAHEQGIVHRDIKPENVMFSKGHAVVTDFGVAKAVSASGSEGTNLTSVGVALGTPTYMAPEQATADPHTDHRADIYAVGVLAYEMVCGRPPFTSTTPQGLLAAHITQAPDHVTKHRATVPPAMAEFIMRCLEKKPADRWQSARDMVAMLNAVSTPTGGMTPMGTQPVPAVATQALGQNQPIRVGVLFALASVGVLAIAYFLMIQLGLPNWVFLGAIALLAVGLPIMLFTGHHERKRAIASATGLYKSTPSGLHRHVTWRKAISGGGLAFAGLALIAGVYTGMRSFGIGPVGSLVASGMLDQSDLLIVSDFDNRTSDSGLGLSLTEALRIDLEQSPVVELMDQVSMICVL